MKNNVSYESVLINFDLLSEVSIIGSGNYGEVKEVIDFEN